MDWTLLSPDLIQQKGRTDAINVGGLIFMAGLVFTATVLFAGIFTDTFPVLTVALFVFFVFGMAAFTAALYFYIRATTGRADKMIDNGLAFIAYELKRKTAALELPATSTPAPTLPLPDSDDETDAANSREGEGGVESHSRALVHGFPPAMLMYLCDYLARGNSWAEKRLQDMPVPHLFPTVNFGKAEGNTVYNRLFHPERGIYCRAGIIIDRGGEANSMGKLAYASPLEMMERIKALPE